MKPNLDYAEVLAVAQNIISKKIVSHEEAVGGVDHTVIKVITESGLKLIIKTGQDAAADVYALGLLTGKSKIPHLLAQTKLHQGEKDYALLVETYLDGVPLQDISAEEKFIYIPQILGELRDIHSIKSPGLAGYVLDVARGEGLSWRNYLMRNLDGGNPEIEWAKIMACDKVDAGLVTRAVEQAKTKVKLLSDGLGLSLIHTDINDVNILVRNGLVTGVIDWSDAKFGDPLFDFARLRMTIQQKMDEKCLQAYWDALNLSPEELVREEAYYLLNLLEYINWYVLKYREQALLTQMRLLEEAIG